MTVRSPQSLKMTIGTSHAETHAEPHAETPEHAIPPVRPEMVGTLDSARSRQRRERITRRLVGLLFFSLLLAAATALRAGDQQVTLPSGRPLPELCGVRRWTGLPCPGCGLTRCFIQLCHGHWRAAWRHHPAGIALFALVVAQIPLNLWQLSRDLRGQPELRLGGWSGALLLGVALLMILQWLTRLLPALLVANH